MPENDRYFVVKLKYIQAIVCVTDKNVNVIRCTNFETCYQSRFLIYGICSNYCPVIAETKKYLFRGIKPKAEIHEIRLKSGEKAGALLQV